jgi:hypothetical protein
VNEFGNFFLTFERGQRAGFVNFKGEAKGRASHPMTTGYGPVKILQEMLSLFME